MVASLGKAITRYPTSFGNWTCLLQEIITGTNEIVVLGKNISAIQGEVLQEYIPHRVLMASNRPLSDFPLIAGKTVADMPYIYLCRNYTCHPPVLSAKGLTTLINSPQNQ
jgi:uncharacterized protein YyaL (SSP411 family)